MPDRVKELNFNNARMVANAAKNDCLLVAKLIQKLHMGKIIPGLVLIGVKNECRLRRVRRSFLRYIDIVLQITGALWSGGKTKNSVIVAKKTAAA